MVSLRQVEKFHRKKQLIKNIIERTLKDKEIVYGERAIEVRVPDYLQRNTKDIDVYANKPLKEAKEAEKELDKEFGGNYFYTVPAKHKGTFKVKSRINEYGYADFTKMPKKRPKSENIWGVNYQTLSEIKKGRIENIKNKQKKFRRGKDKDALNRIKIYERQRRFFKW